MFKHNRGLAALALALFLPLTGCGDATDNEFGSVSVLLTDAPGDVVQAWVTFTDIYLQGEDGENDLPERRVFLLQNAQETHELLSLANEVESLVVGQEVPTGSYGQLRVIISEGCIETKDGGVFSSSPDFTLCGAPTGNLQMPSFAQTGVKVLLNGLQVDGDQEVVLLDFNVERSFGQEAGMSGMWVMTPVIHASEIELTVGVNATLRAEADVDVDPSQFSAILDPQSDNGETKVQAFTDEDGDGTFEVSFGPLIANPNGFVVTLDPPEGVSVTTDEELSQTVSPASGETATAGWVITASGS